jgi:hypothetical protein
VVSLPNMAAGIGGRLKKGQELLDVSKVQFAMGSIGERQKLTLLLRTVEPLTSQMRAARPQQIPAKIILNCLAVSMAAWHQTSAGRLEVFSSEAMLLSVLDTSNASEFGIVLDETTGMVTFPRVQIPMGKEAFQRQFSKPSNRWMQSMFVEPHPRPADDSAYLEVLHVPDLPPAELTDDTLTRAIQLAMGWNYLQLTAPEYMANAMAELRTELASAKTL